MLLLFLFPFIAASAYFFQFRLAERRRTSGGAVIATVRGVLHALCVIVLGATSPQAFEFMLVSRSALTMICGALCASASFAVALTLADKVIDFVLALFLVDSYGADFLPFRVLARLEMPEVVTFATLMVGWAVIAAWVL